MNKNALDAMLSEPSKIEDPQFVDEPKGNLQSKVNSGMMPNYVEKPKFGKVPGYLKRRKQEQVDEQKRWEEETMSLKSFASSFVCHAFLTLKYLKQILRF